MTNMGNSPIFDENISVYKHLLETLRSENSGRFIRNDSIVHAEVLVCNLLKHAQHEILIYSSSFCKEFYSRDMIAESLNVSTQRGVTIKLLLSYRLNEENVKHLDQIEFIKEFSRQENVEVKILRKKDDLVIEDVKLNNFIVVDEKAFRYEKEPPSDDECYIGMKETMAIGSLNDSEVGLELKNAFDRAFVQAIEFSE